MDALDYIIELNNFSLHLLSFINFCRFNHFIVKNQYLLQEKLRDRIMYLEYEYAGNHFWILFNLKPYPHGGAP